MAFLAYDVAADRWDRLPGPDSGGLAKVGDLLVAYRVHTDEGGRDQYWDAAGRAWRDLPAAPGGPRDGRQLVEVGAAGVLVGVAEHLGSPWYGDLAAQRLDPATRTWSELLPPGTDNRLAVDGAPWFSVDGRAVAVSHRGTREHVSRSYEGPSESGQLGGVLDEHGWQPLPPRPRAITTSEEQFPWAFASGGGFVVGGRQALHVATRTWQELPALPALSGMGGDPAVTWAGDRLFAWGGQQSPDGPLATGWTWTPAPPPATPALTTDGSWIRVADGPLAGRREAATAWAAGRVVVFGGHASGCGTGGADSGLCEAPKVPSSSDAAEYDPATDTWEQVPPAPVPVRAASTAVIGDTVHALVRPDFHSPPGTGPAHISYDVGMRLWQRLPDPPASAEVTDLLAAGDLLVAYRTDADGGPDLWFDAAEGAWRQLPAAPGGAMGWRRLVAVDEAVLLIGALAWREVNGPADRLAAARFDPETKRWSALPAGEENLWESSPWWAVGGRAVNVAVPGRPPYGAPPVSGAGGVLDPDGGWSRLPDVPALSTRPDELAPWAVAGGGGYVVGGRWALDVAARAWQEIPVETALERIQHVAVTWAGDRLFAWGGARPSNPVSDVGWTWRPRPR